jgi:type VI secretion system secreted protein Hcp
MDGESSWRHLRVSWKVVVPTVLALGFGGAVAAASIPGSNGVIMGCYVTNSAQDYYEQPIGSLRVIDPSDTTDSTPGASSCLSGETTINWNQQGPTGATGPQGPAGQNGQNGQNGAQGPQGPAGVSASGGGSGGHVIMKLNPANANLGSLTPVGETVNNTLSNQTFDISSFELGATSQVNIGSATTGAGRGKATFQKFVVTKPVDKYSSVLFLDLTKGTLLKSAEIIVRKTGANGMAVPYAQYLMKQVAITDIHVSGGSGTPTETIQGEYGAIQFVIYEQNPNGTTKVGSAGGWSQVTNQPVSTGVIGSLTSKRHRRR